jgi:hypothetical protein
LPGDDVLDAVKNMTNTKRARVTCGNTASTWSAHFSTASTKRGERGGDSSIIPSAFPISS